jgi:hypothetical protein
MALKITRKSPFFDNTLAFESSTIYFMNDKKSGIKLLRLRNPEGTRDFFLGYNAALSMDDLKVKYPQLIGYQFEQAIQYQLPAKQEP